MDYDDRLEKLRRIIFPLRLDGLLVSGEKNVQYLSGFTGDSGWALITGRRAFLITDFRYREQAEKEVHSAFRVVESISDYLPVLRNLCGKLKLARLGFESRHISYALYQKLKRELKGRRLRSGEGWIEKLRIRKSESELEVIRSCADLTVRSLDEAVVSLKRGVTEKEIANRIAARIRAEGGVPAFEPIVASASRSSQPHAFSSARLLKKGDILLIDLGAKRNHYNSDLTRTFVLNEYPPRFRKLYRLVQEAQNQALAAVSPGVKAADVDRAAREFLAAEGYGHRFGHALGHGLGLEIHEEPRLSSNSDTVLEEGMVFTIEPGIYLPGWGGIRIEDTIRVTAEGYEILTPAPKDLSSALINLQ